MELTKTNFRDLIICNPKVYKDERGYFYESFNSQEFNNLTGLDPVFVQDNQSHSSFGVLRGLHFQKEPYAQAKLVRVLRGEVLDVVVDLRKDEPTYGKSFSIILSAQNKTQLFVPRGFAHGFLVLSSEATFFYKCDNYYHKESELSLKYNDPILDINWHLPQDDLVLSEKDKQALDFNSLKDLL